MKQYCFKIFPLFCAAVLLVGFRQSIALDASKNISQYHQDFWTEEDGLPQGSVQAITQGKSGYLWIGTRDGLARFDGVKFTVFRSDDHAGLLSDDIRSLYEDNLGRLWIGTFNGGVSCFEEGVFRHYSAENGLHTTGVLEIYQDTYGHLWFGNWGGIARFNRGQFDNYGTGEGLVGRNGWSFCQDAEGVFWAATDRAIHRFRDGKFQVENDFNAHRRRDIRKIHMDRQGVFWVGTLNGLVRHEKGAARVFTMADRLADNRVRTLAEDSSGNIWVGTWDGLSRIQGTNVTSFPKTGERISGMIEALFVDRDGSLWIGVRGGGLGRLRDAPFSNLTMREGLRSRLPRCVFEASDKAIWIGSDGGGLTKIQNGTTEHFGRTNGLPSDFVASVAEDKKEQIWVGLGRPAAVGLIRGGKVERILDADDGLPFEYSVRAVFVDRSDDVWAGGDGGLCRIRNGVITRIEGLPKPPIRVIKQDRSGRIWAGADEGLCRIEGGRVSGVYTTQSGLAHDAVYSFFEDTAGTIWLGTQQGLTRMKDDRFVSFTREKGGFQGTIYHVMEDDNGMLWMASSRGISAVKRMELELVLDGKKERVEPISYGVADGLKSTQCQGGSQSPGVKSADGRLWFATLNGVAVIKPTEREPHSDPPAVLIESIRADRAEFSPMMENRFRAGTEDFEFIYTALRFITPEKVQFRYRLIGHDRDWVHAGTRRAAYYNNLRPAHFTFEVSASSDGKTWSQPVSTVRFILEPHFYQTRSFYLSAAAAVLGVGFVVHRYRMKRQREQFSLILDERTRIARDLHDTMAQGFAGTAFQLEALQSSLAQAPESTRRHLDLALTMVRHSFSEAKRTVMNLRSPLLQDSDLVGAVTETGRQMLSDSGISLEVKTIGKPSRLNSETETQVLRICQEALANVVKHANASRIEVFFDFSQTRPQIVIKDNGRGFDLEETEKRNGHHFGLRGMKERIKQLGAKLVIKTAPGDGTELRVSLN